MARTKETAKTVVDPYQNVRATVEREDDEVQIDLMELLYRLIEKMRYIVTATVACALAAALITMLFISPKYTATAKLYVKNGSGSGILVSEKGLVFSAAHVVDKKGTTLKIILPDGTRLPGKTTAQNSNSDAGMAKITSQLNKKLPCVEKAEKMPRVGDWVFALGHGGGLDRKRGPMVRLGRVVSLKNGVIQTDCKLIRGDSGGPLFNLDGKLIGIHSRVGSGLEDNLHVPMKDFNTLTEETAEGKTSLTPSPEQDSQPFSTQPS